MQTLPLSHIPSPHSGVNPGEEWVPKEMSTVIDLSKPESQHTKEMPSRAQLAKCLLRRE